MPRGVPMAEKKKMLLRVYHSRKEPFGLKELEKAGGKAGLHEKQVKEINALLLDDNAVFQDKIGQSVVYWSFPAAQGVELRAQVNATKRKVAAAESRLAEAKKAEAKAAEGRRDDDAGSRASKLRRLGDLVDRRKQLEAKYETVKENDPAELKRIQDATKDFKVNAERWTENLFSVKGYLVKKKNVDPSSVDDLFKSVGLPADLDLD